MPTNRELKERASTLARELGVEVVLEQNNAALVALVAELEARQAAAGGEPGTGPLEVIPAAAPVAPLVNGADDSVGGPPPVTKAAPVSRFPLSVTMGRSITGPRGIVADGKQVLEADYPPDVLAGLIARGFVVDQRPKADPGPG